jgi:hypothetical protein
MALCPLGLTPPGEPFLCEERGIMGWLRDHLIWGAVLIPLAGVLAACDDGPAEQAGEAADEAADDAGDAVEDATD